MDNCNKELTQFELAVCDNQGVLFQECQWDFNADAQDFIQKFMTSNVAKNMDNEISPFHNTGIIQIGNALKSQTEISPCVTLIQNADLLYWIGYLYRYWNMWLKHSSASIYQKADFCRMSAVYTQFHTLAPEQAIMRLVR